MTGGICVVLGKVGKNFAAGMTGGLAYVWCPTTGTGGGDQDREADFRRQCNMELVSLYKLNEVDPADAEHVRALIQQHADYTGSRVAAELLARWPEVLFCLFFRVFHGVARYRVRVVCQECACRIPHLCAGTAPRRSVSSSRCTRTTTGV
jgi:hypothetical protein